MGDLLGIRDTRTVTETSPVKAVIVSSVLRFLSSDINKSKREHSVIYPSCLLEGGACVITDVGEGSVGCSGSLLK